MNPENMDNNILTSFLRDFEKDPRFVFAQKLRDSFERSTVHLVGGKVRDIYLERESKDFDFLVTGIDPKKLEKALSEIGEVGLVGKAFGIFIFKPEKSKDPHEIEIALPRTEKAGGSGAYQDFEVQSDPDLPIEDDLKRRDFTINAMALDVKTGELTDPFDGKGDIERKLIKSVGKPEDRFLEDYTRMLRAVRFAAQLDFDIEEKTFKAIKKLADNVETLPAERIMMEINKIIMSDNPRKGFEILRKTGLLGRIFPELEESIGVDQNKNHIYTVYEHLLNALQFAADREYSLPVRLGVLFHDIGKPQTKEGEGKTATFYNHEIEGAKIVKKILQRMKYPNQMITKVNHLVRQHMFYTDFELSDAGVRRLLRRVGKEHIDDVIRLRICDRLGMGRPKDKPRRLAELEKRLKLVQMDPISVKMLAIDGDNIMELLDIKPGIRIKYLKEALLNEVLEDPKFNTKAKLTKRLRELHKLSDDELKKLSPDFKEVHREQKQKYLGKQKFVK